MLIAQIEILDNLNQNRKANISAPFTLNETMCSTGSLPLKMFPHYLENNLF